MMTMLLVMMMMMGAVVPGRAKGTET